MKPYYQSSTVTAYNCRFQEVIKDLPSDLLVVSDPPYNIGFKYDLYKDTMPDDEYIEMLAEFQKFGRVVLCHYPVETMRWIVPALGVPNHVSAWCYNSNAPGRLRLISWYGCEPEYSRIKQPYKNLDDRRIKEAIANGSEGTGIYEWWTDIQQVKNVSAEKTSHPCPVPEALQRRIITLVAKKDDVIFDPFGGSLTTCKAAQDLGHKSIACELSESYLKEGIGRLAQPSFFTLPNNRLHMDAGDSPRLPSQSTLEGFTPAEQGSTPAPRQ